MVELSGVISSDESGAAFAGSWAFGAAIASLACFLLIFFRSLTINPILRVVRLSTRQKARGLLSVCRRLTSETLKLLFFALLATYGVWSFAAIVGLGIDIFVAAIIFESIPILYFLFAAPLFSRVATALRHWRKPSCIQPSAYEGRGRAGSIFEILLRVAGMLVLFAGLYFVAASISMEDFVKNLGGDVEAFPGHDGPLQWIYTVPRLLSLVLIFAVVTLTFVPIFWWSRRIASQVSADASGVKSDPNALLYFLAAFSICFLISAWFYNAMAESVSNGDISIYTRAYGVTGGVITSFGIVFWQRAHGLSLATNISLKAQFDFLNWLRPVTAFVLLFIFSVIGSIEGNARLDYIWLGATGLTIYNLLRNFDSRIVRSLGGRATVIALWFCGVVVYIRDDLFGFMNIKGWLWPDSAHYELLALSATIFTLLLAFRIARLVGRTTDEDNRTFTLSQKLDRLIQRDIISAEIRQSIQELDVLEQQLEELRRAYNEAMEYVSKANAKCDDSDAGNRDRDKLSEVVFELNALVHSKTQGILPGEFFALGGFACITIGIALFSRPEGVSGLSGFLTEIFAILFSTIIVFMTFNLQDLQRKRIDPVLERGVGNDEPFSRMKFQSQTSIIEFIGNNLIPFIVPLIVFFIWSILLMTKWFNYWSFADWFISQF